MIIAEISETTIVLLIAIALYLAFIAIDWASSKAKRWWNRRRRK